MRRHLFALATVTFFMMSAPPLAAAQTIDTLAKVKAAGTIAMGVRDASGALSYSMGNGKYGGYQVEICQRIAAHIEKIVERKLSVQYVLVNSQNRIQLVQDGTVDMECGSTTNNLARQKDVAFSVTTYVEEVRLAVRASSGISSVKNLGGKTVATTRGTTSVQTLRKQARANSVEFSEVFGNDHADSFQLLETGRADAFLMDGQILAGHIARARHPSDFKIVGEILSVEPIAIMFRKEDAALKKLADDTLHELRRTNELAKLYDKWFMQPFAPKKIPLGLPLSEATRAAWANLNDKPMEDYVRK